jgi:nicotinamide-nucleotide amidase
MRSAASCYSLVPMVSDAELYELAARVGHKLRAAERRMVTAESCTGGWVARALTDIPGSSQWFECGYVTYSNTAKNRDLGVAAGTLERFGAVSEQTVREMAEGALRVSGANVALAVSGIAGPDGGAPGKPVGTVWFCAAARQERAIDIIAEEKLFAGDRAFVRSHAVQHALRLILRLDLPVNLTTPPRADPP